MQVEPLSIPGVYRIKPRVFGDDRGYFMETYNAETWRRYLPPVRWVQDNESRSRRGVLRGLHYQRAPYAQTKLVRVVEGKIWDVAVDLRPHSPTFKQWVALELSGESQEQFLVPAGCAHGFVVLSESAIVAYKVDVVYHPEADGGVRWNDPELAINWPLG